MRKYTEEQINAACTANGWVRTGVYATEAEITLSREWATEYADTPVIKVHGRWLHEDAETIFKQRIDELAMSHGLPDRGEDHYGLIASGEFTTSLPEDS